MASTRQTYAPRSALIELREETADVRAQTGELRIFGQPLAECVPRFSLAMEDHNLVRIRKNEPYDGDTMLKVPMRLVAENLLVFVAPSDLHGEHGRNVTQAAYGRTHLCALPYGGIGGADVVTEFHACFVPTHDEARMSVGPAPQDMDHVYRDVLLDVGARRHV